MNRQRKRLTRALSTGVALAMATVAVGSPALGATTPVRPGPDLGDHPTGWALVTTGDAELAPPNGIQVDAGWADESATGAASGAGSVKLLPGANVQTSVGTYQFEDTALTAITNLRVRLRTADPKANPPVFSLRLKDGSLAPPTLPENCQIIFRFPADVPAFTTFNLATEAGWSDSRTSNRKCGGASDLFPVNSTWATVLDAFASRGFRDAEIGGSAGLPGVAFLVGSPGDSTNSYSTTYVDTLALNSSTTDFEPPTLALTGTNLSIDKGQSIAITALATLSGPNQPVFYNDVNPLTGFGGLTSQATARVTGPCTVTSKPTPIAFAPKALLLADEARTQRVTLTVKASSTAAGLCKITLASPVNAAVTGGVSVVVRPQVYVPDLTPVTCSAKAVSKKSKIKVDVGPDLPGNGHYKFRLDVKRDGKWFRYLHTYKTKGAKETRTVNVPKGTYRAKCYGPVEQMDSRSKVVKIKK